MNTFSLLSLLVLALSATAHPDGTDQPQPAIEPSPWPQGTGTPCGEKLSSVCNDGLVCAGATAVRAGMCVPESQIGGKCGGSVQYPSQCTPNASCSSSTSGRMGAFGTCVEVRSGFGEECGGGTRYARRCQPTLLCHTPGGRMGGKGMCVRTGPIISGGPIAGFGEQCGGGTRFAAHCGAGLTCQTISMIVGAKGRCAWIPANEGEKCGGGLENAIPCAEGLRCQIFSMVVGLKVGGTGKCVKA